MTGDQGPREFRPCRRALDENRVKQPGQPPYPLAIATALLDRGFTLAVEGAEIDQDRIGAGDKSPDFIGRNRHRRHSAGSEQHIRRILLGHRIGYAMHARGTLADTREHVRGNIGKLDWCMHFLSSRGDSTMLLRARAVHPLWYKVWIGSEVRMIPFFVQIKCQLGKAYDVAGKLADAEIASEIYSTAGDFDLLVKFYVEPSTDIGHFIAEKVQTIPGIADTRTIITFKAFGGS